MTPDQELHLDHTDDRQGYLGLSHARCNLSHGATMGNRMRARPWWQRRARQQALFPVSQVKAPKPRRVPRREARPRSTAIAYYACRYCGEIGVTRDIPAGHGRREVCPARDCQAARLRVNRLVHRYGLSRKQAEAEAGVTSCHAEGHHPGRSAALPGRTHRCAVCGAVTAGFRWCDACRCISLNAKGKRCGNVAADQAGQCDYHASLAA